MIKNTTTIPVSSGIPKKSPQARNLEKILRSIQNIPAFPVTVQKISQLLQGEYSATQLANVIKLDAAITANILKMSNSAYFGARQEIKSIIDAVTYLGKENLIRVTQTASMSRFYTKPATAYAAKPADLWEHSVAVALLSQILSKKIHGRGDDVLYTAALLHDIGKFIMSEFTQEFEEIMELVAHQGYSFLDAEEKVIGINHSELGGRIAVHWKFPREIKDAIAFHHRPDLLKETNSDIPWLVYLAEQLCPMIGLDGGVDGFAQRGVGEALRRYKLRARDLEEALLLLSLDLQRAKDVINVL
jgi:putative nucleotidyltransferase with HDIG domain